MSGGKVVLVATPIGNLGDISPRAVAALADADVIYAEDTRRTRALLTAVGVHPNRLKSMGSHNEESASASALAEALGGATVAVVSDAGSPGISDPGGRLVAAAREAGVVVEAVPGACAAIVALTISGLAAERFCFEGFLPARGGERGRRLAAIAAEERTTVIYEAPHRVERTLQELVSVCGTERLVAVARELTKVHEESWTASLGEAVQRVQRDWGAPPGGGPGAGAAEGPRGEWVLVLAGASPTLVGDAEIVAALEAAFDAARDEGGSRRDVISSVATALGVGRRRVYELAHISPDPAETSAQNNSPRPRRPPPVR